MIIDTAHNYYPELMKSLPNWVLWKLEEDEDGKLTKVPYSALYNGRASSTNPNTWTSFKNVMDVYQNSNKYSGIGFVFNRESGLVFIDIDHCIDEDGVFNSTAQDILNTVNYGTYAEVSQSGSGIHIFTIGTIPKAFKYNSVEMYCEKRFVAMTGNAFIRKDVKPLPEETFLIYERYRKPERHKASKESDHIRVDVILNLSDNDIIKKASENSVDFMKLYNGDISGLESHSNADFRLCSIIAFWCDRDYDTIERIFSSSGLNRDKWRNRSDYRHATICEACNRLNESLSEYIDRKRIEEVRRYERYFMHKQDDSR